MCEKMVQIEKLPKSTLKTVKTSKISVQSIGFKDKNPIDQIDSDNQKQISTVQSNIKNDVKSSLLIQKNKNLIAEFRNLFRAWLATTTTHGLSLIFSNRPNYMKILWSILFIISNVGCVYFVIIYFIKYFQYKKNINLEILNDIPANFPAVTVCNLNPFYLPRASNYITSILQKQNLTYVINITDLTIYDPNETAFSLLTSTQDVIKASILSDSNLNTTSKQLLGWKM